MGETHLAAGFDPVKPGTSFEGAVRAANKLADEVESERVEELSEGESRLCLSRFEVGFPGFVVPCPSVTPFLSGGWAAA
jgi:hypothetical protein